MRAVLYQTFAKNASPLADGRALWRIHHPWPLIPAVILFAVGGMAAIAELPSVLAGGMIWLPLLLVGAGLYLGWLRR